MEERQTSEVNRESESLLIHLHMPCRRKANSEFVVEQLHQTFLPAIEFEVTKFMIHNARFMF
jgi:hypothetical protein